MQPLPEHPEDPPTPHLPPTVAAAGEAVVRSAVVGGGQEFLAETESPNERIAQTVCRELLMNEPGYQGTFSFGTPGGNDLDLRLCFEDLSQVEQESIRERLLRRLHAEGVDVEVDLLFMSGEEFVSGIRDLVELGDVAERLYNGFDPHEQQAAVGDTSMFSLYIFSTMRMLHRNQNAGQFGSPQEALDRLVLTRDGAVGWMHFYTGCFLHEYLHQQQDPALLAKYQERLAKFVSRVAHGSTLAHVEPESKLDDFKPLLITAIREADANNSTDVKMTDVLLAHPDTFALLDVHSQDVLRAAGEIRSGRAANVALDFIPAAEAELFYQAFQQGIHRRPELGEDADPLTSYALGELVRDLGSFMSYSRGTELMTQGGPPDEVIYIPLKTNDGRDNAGVDIIVADAEGEPVAYYTRTPGRVVGEGAIFGLPRSATVTARDHLETHVISAQTIRDLLTDQALYQQLQQPHRLETRNARRLDVLLRYFAREAAIFTRQTLPYTSLASREAASEALGENPLAAYNLKERFHDTLQQFADSEAHPQVTTVMAEQGARTLFEANQPNDRLYVVSNGTVQIPLQNGEIVTLEQGEYFGESSLLGMPTTGAAILPEGSSVLAVEISWFKRFTQSRQPIKDIELPEELRGVLPVHLLYHLAAEGYDRVRRRLSTQQHRLSQ